MGNLSFSCWDTPDTCRDDKHWAQDHDACPPGYEYKEACFAPCSGVKATYECVAEQDSWYSMLHGECEDFSGRFYPKPGQYCGHPNAPDACWLPYTASKDANGTLVSCTPADPSGLGYFDANGDVQQASAGDALSENPSGLDSYTRYPLRIEQEPATNGGAVLAGSGIGAAAVVGGFFKMKQQKRKAPGKNGASALELKAQRV
jgi:hypothetical protein